MLSLGQAVAMATKLKNGEAVEPVQVGGVLYYPRTAVKYVAGKTIEISNSDLIVSSQDEKVGVRNINGNKLDYPFLALGVRMLFDTSTGVGVTPETAVWNDEAPNYLKNGELEIKQGKELLPGMPISTIAYTNLATPRNADDQFFPIIPFLIRPDKAFEIKAIAAGAAVADEAYRLELKGIEFVRANQ